MLLTRGRLRTGNASDRSGFTRTTRSGTWLVASAVAEGPRGPPERPVAERKILQLGDPILWQTAEEVVDPRSSPTQELVSDLSDTLAAFRHANGFGRGIAAPQIGVLKRVLFIRLHPAGFCSALINPRLTRTSAETIEIWDDCFSLPNLMVKVRRFAICDVAYLDERGVPHTLEASGDLSELVQHEIDHLDGILAVQRALSPRAFCMRSEWERRYRPQ